MFWFSRFFLWNTAKTWSKVQVTTEIILAQHLGYKVLSHIHVIFYRSSVHYYWKWMFSCWTILSEVIPTHCDIMTPTCTYSYYFKLSNTYVALQRLNRNFELRDNLCNCRHFFRSDICLQFYNHRYFFAMSVHFFLYVLTWLWHCFHRMVIKLFSYNILKPRLYQPNSCNLIKQKAHRTHEQQQT